MVRRKLAVCGKCAAKVERVQGEEEAEDIRCSRCREVDELRVEFRLLKKRCSELEGEVRALQQIKTVGVASTQTEVGNVGNGSSSSTEVWEKVSGKKSYSRVVQGEGVLVSNRFSQLGCGDVGGLEMGNVTERVREETIVMGDSLIRRVDSVVCRRGKGKCVRVCLPGAGLGDVQARVGEVMGPGKGGSILVHAGTNDIGRKGSEEIMGRYRELVRELKRLRVGQIILSGILPVMGGRNSRRMSINHRLQGICEEEGVGFIDSWHRFYGREDLFHTDGLHLNNKGAMVLGKCFVRAIGDGIGNLN